jgi:polyhydroxyalkanoate synthesis regulator protein
MKMFNPFAAGARTPGAATPPAGSAAKSEEMDALKAQLNAMQAQLEKLVKDKT